jgi:predicted MPP superfamily phosphohydrolase
VGCAGTGNNGQILLAESMAKLAADFKPDFILYLGDNFYGRGVSSVEDIQWQTKFENIFKPEALPVPFYAVLGNHDYYLNPDAQVAYLEKIRDGACPHDITLLNGH